MSPAAGPHERELIQLREPVRPAGASGAGPSSAGMGAGAQSHQQQPQQPQQFTHGTTSVMRMCRAGQQMCVFWTAGIGPRLAGPLPCATAAGDEPRR